MAESEMISVPTVAGNVALAITRAGTRADVVVFVHGWAHSSSVWQEVIKLLPCCAIAIDLPGFGSSPPLLTRYISADVYADVLHAALRAIQQEVAATMLVADSFGALLTIECMARGDSVVPANVFLSGCPLDGLPRVIRTLRADAFTGPGLQLLKALPFSVAHVLASRSNYLTVQKRGPFERIITAMIRQADSSTARRTLKEMYRPYVLPERLLCDRYKITLSRGSEDKIFGARSLEAWASALSASAVTFPGLGHTPMLEGPNEYARAVASALNRAQTASASPGE